MTTRALAILIFEDVEVLDFCGPFEVFTVANRFTDPPAFNAFTVAEKAGPVLTRGGLSVNPRHRLADCPRPDLLLVPGGQGTRHDRFIAFCNAWKAASPPAGTPPSVPVPRPAAGAATGPAPCGRPPARRRHGPPASRAS